MPFGGATMWLYVRSGFLDGKIRFVLSSTVGSAPVDQGQGQQK